MQQGAVGAGDRETAMLFERPRELVEIRVKQRLAADEDERGVAFTILGEQVLDYAPRKFLVYRLGRILFTPPGVSPLVTHGASQVAAIREHQFVDEGRRHLVVLPGVLFEPPVTLKELQLLDDQVFDVARMPPRKFGQAADGRNGHDDTSPSRALRLVEFVEVAAWAA
jgi:hypothetical protein